MNPKVSVLARLFEPNVTSRGDIDGPMMTFEDMLRFAREAGVLTIGCNYGIFAGAETAVRKQALADAGITISYLTCAPLADPTRPETWEANAKRLEGIVALASDLGVSCVHGTTGPRYPLEWEEAADGFCQAVKFAAAAARQAGLSLSIEPTNLYNADISFLHTLGDTLDLAERAGIGVTIDLNHCGTERRLEEVIRRAGSRLKLVQLSDLIADRHERFRAVPGDGVFPIMRILECIFSTGYDGYIDLELSREAGVPAAETARRGAETVSRMLDELGV